MHLASCIDRIFDTSNINNTDDENKNIENSLDDNFDKNDMENNEYHLEHNRIHNNANNGNKTSINPLSLENLSLKIKLVLEKNRLSELRLKIKERNACFQNEQERIYNNLLKQESELVIKYLI